MDHAAGHGGSDQASDAPFDAMFIDGMIVHHEGAIEMAQEALQQAERPEVKQLAQQIIDSQEQEVEQMQTWREQWYPDLAPTGGMHNDMGAMEVSDDASKPFDQRFIEAMIPHHQSAIDMAQEAQQNAEHAEIKQLSGEIVQAQQAEIQQMEQWLQQWFGG
jgi:uncharacterized protein (DUF305 family)